MMGNFPEVVHNLLGELQWIMGNLWELQKSMGNLLGNGLGIMGNVRDCKGLCLIMDKCEG